MINKRLFLIASFLFVSQFVFSENKTSIPQHLQDVSVTIISEGNGQSSEGSGIIFTRKNKNGDNINFIWTAAHVIDNLKTTREVVVGGVKKTIVEFKDPKILKEIREDGRTIGRLELDAEVIKFSDVETGHDLALLRLRKKNFLQDSVVFHLEPKLPELGTDLVHVGSLLGSSGANSMTAGIYSQHGRVLPYLNKFIFDQTTVTAFRGSSGGGVFLKHNAEYVGMLVRGAGETFNLIVPVRRMKDFCEKNKLMWALDVKIPLPDDDELKKIAVEEEPKQNKSEETPHQHKQNKEFPFLIKRTVIPNEEKLLLK